ncbi:MAG TPA: DUF6624 domain-containing protein [Pyrinomonadaceae bacterium]|nr:DUF6624 domain-containing protein [Pyrinomonadaceae bacterium]
MRLILILILVCAGLCTAQTNPALRDELLKMRETDQQAREQCAKGNGDEQVKCLAETLEKIDKPNTARLEEIFNTQGFPTAKEVGKDGVEAFLLILQHAPDEALRQKCLKPVKKAFKRKEITPSEFAGYVDRLLVRQNKPQIYGSNFDFKEGRLVMSAVKDRKNLDARRRKIGLPPIEEYAKKLKEFYNLEVVF